MQHKTRTWKVTSITSSSELTTQLTEYRHCLCKGFSVEPYLFLNDSESEQDATYAICLDESHSYKLIQSPLACTIRQIETKTFKFLSYSDAKTEVDAVLAGRYNFYHFGTIAHQRLNYGPRRILCNQCIQTY